VTSHVDEQVAARIAAAKNKRQQRAELDAARIPGLAARHNAKMRRWALEGDEPGFPGIAEEPGGGE
jgi:hypothetical protein